MSKYILSDIFQGDFPISQKFGVNPKYYKEFGFDGHEGIDWKTPIGTPIYAPFDGIIVRDIDDPKSGAYGNHLVVWDPVQKCAVWFCHLFGNNVSNGDKVKKGQKISDTGNSGNTTGPHLHFNFCETDATGNRINTGNGYKGFLDPLNKDLVEWKLASNTPQTPPVTSPSVITAQSRYDFGGEVGEVELGTAASMFKAKDQLIKQQVEEIGRLNEKLLEVPSGNTVTKIVYETETFPSFIRRVFKLQR